MYVQALHERSLGPRGGLFGSGSCFALISCLSASARPVHPVLSRSQPPSAYLQRFSKMPDHLTNLHPGTISGRCFGEEPEQLLMIGWLGEMMVETRILRALAVLILAVAGDCNQQDVR